MATKREIILTGDRPTGKLHLGHYVGSLKSRVELQHQHEQFILLADLQAMGDNAGEIEKIRQGVLDVALDYLAVGIDFSLSTVYVQTAVPEITELMSFFLNVIGFGRVERNPTVKTEIRQRGLDDGVTAGFVVYPVSQAADIAAFKATLVPVGEDQVPMIELTNDIVGAFNRLYPESTLVECRALVPKGGGSRLVGIDGKAKMSKSLGNALYLADSPNEISKKVKQMYTDPQHLRVEDPGHIEGNVVFSYLDVFDPNQEEVAELKAHYQRGGLGDGVVKKRLEELLQEILRPIRTRREQYAADPGAVIELLKQGTARARERVTPTLDECKRAMGINYF